MVEKGSIIVDVILRRLGPSGWPNVIGIRGRMWSESVAECGRNMHPILSDYGLRVAPVTITERRAFARAVATGRAVTEFEPDGKAAEKVRTL